MAMTAAETRATILRYLQEDYEPRKSAIIKDVAECEGHDEGEDCACPVSNIMFIGDEMLRSIDYESGCYAVLRGLS